ncbi:MAG: hypothetical protein OZ921_00290 [Sorangiineae bacterium]|nr:hypothetical protein [Polyangiaceae bacterium]MEB2320922.1 hypothetical protein [Sorangiineae bacterium]
MRLGLLGPAEDREEALERAVEFLFQDVAVGRAVYLGVDQALERVVRRRAEQLVGGDPDDDAIWRRAAEACARASAAEIDSFIVVERERRALSVFESLPGNGKCVIELLNGKLVVMTHDKADLDEEDILPASLLVFGKSAQPLVKQVGSRWFLAPGHLGEFGVMTLEDHDDGIHLALFDSAGREVRRERLIAAHQPKLRVTGAAD